jgi:hypothetical protein
MLLRTRASIQQACIATVSRCDIQVQGDGVLKVPVNGSHRDGGVAGRCAWVLGVAGHLGATSARDAGQYNDDDGGREPGMTALRLPDDFQN